MKQIGEQISQNECRYQGYRFQVRQRKEYRTEQRGFIPSISLTEAVKKKASKEDLFDDWRQDDAHKYEYQRILELSDELEDRFTLGDKACHGHNQVMYDDDRVSNDEESATDPERQAVEGAKTERFPGRLSLCQDNSYRCKIQKFDNDQTNILNETVVFPEQDGCQDSQSQDHEKSYPQPGIAHCPWDRNLIYRIG